MTIKYFIKELALILTLIFPFIFLSFFNLENNSSNEIDEYLYKHPEVVDAIQPYCNGLNYEFVKQEKNTNIKTVNLKIADTNSWYKNLFEASIEGGADKLHKSIKERYKKYFKGELEVIFFNNKSCTFRTEVRISGDWLDHIDLVNFTSSLDVKILDGNLLGITNFKLFIPKTRGGDNEIFTTTILENYGFLVPKTFYIDVNFNNLGIKQFLFQEKFNKEFLESNSLREGPIVETDETYFWNTTTGVPFYEENNQILTFGKIRNKNWSKRSSNNEFISLHALSKYNKAVNSNLMEGFLYSDLNNSLAINTFEAFVTALQANHMLTNHQRVFYYNRIDDNFIPIYYDGNSNFLNAEDLSIRYRLFDLPGLMIGTNNAISLIENNPLPLEEIQKKLKQKGMQISLNSLDKLKYKLLENLQKIKSQFTIEVHDSYPDSNKVRTRLDQEGIEWMNNSDWTLEYNSRLVNSKERGVEFILKDNENNYYICDQKLQKCNTFLLEVENIFNNPTQNNQHIYGLFDIDTEYQPSTLYSTKEFRIKTFNQPEVNINETSKEIDINFTDASQKVLFLENSLIEKFTININSNQTNISEVRSDQNLLTGCVTFYDVEFSNININMSGSHCEDSINIITSRGSINKINITDSSQDALDIDFSDLQIKNIEIKNAGNDCLDVSGSKFFSEEINLNTCEDKGFSIGENSYAEISNIFVFNSHIGIAVKDLSSLKSQIANINNSNLCVAVYQKKQEFGPAVFESLNFNCTNNQIFIQKGSKFEIGK